MTDTVIYVRPDSTANVYMRGRLQATCESEQTARRIWPKADVETIALKEKDNAGSHS